MSQDIKRESLLGLIIILLILAIIIFVVVVCVVSFIDMMTLQTSIENATIVSITTTNDHYTYDLNVSGSWVINVVSNNFYQLNQTLSVALTRGSFTHSTYGGVLIIGEV